MKLRMTEVAGLFAVCRLDSNHPLPQWPAGEFVSITRTKDELSIVCHQESVPDDVRAERDWRLLRVEGPIPFEVTGVASAITAPLAEAGISVFLVSTFDTDYLLVKDAVYERALSTLRNAAIAI